MGTKATLYIYDGIGGEGVTAKAIVEQLRALPADVNILKVHINSSGGYVHEGVAIYHALKNHPAKVIVIVDGMAASAASVIAMAGDEIHMADGSLMMIHNPSVDVSGGRKELESAIQSIDASRSALVGIYQSRTQLGTDRIAALMESETWFGAAEAVNLGFATHLDSGRVATFARVDLSGFKNLPKALLKPQSTVEQLERKYGKKAVQAALMQARSELAPKTLTAEQKALIKAMEEQQKIRFPCPGCGQGLKANPDSIGKDVRCPKCGQIITVTREPQAKAPKCLADVLRIANSSSAVRAAATNRTIAALKTTGHSAPAPKSLADVLRLANAGK